MLPCFVACFDSFRIQCKYGFLWENRLALTGNWESLYNIAHTYMVILRKDQ